MIDALNPIEYFIRFRPPSGEIYLDCYCPGTSYCRFLNNRKAIKHYGIGGNTVIGLNNISSRYIINHKDLLILEIGTNDILLPYLKSLSDKWSITVESIVKKGRVPTRDITEFKTKYQELLQKYSSNKKILISIPCIGENTKSSINMQVNKYNEIISELCIHNDCLYLDFNSTQKDLINKSAMGTSNFLIGTNPLEMIMDVIFSRSKKAEDKISKKRNLLTTIDGVHLNSFGAFELAKMLDNAIQEFT